MLKCWEENPRDRPSFAKLKDTMKEMERYHRVMQFMSSLILGIKIQNILKRGPENFYSLLF